MGSYPGVLIRICQPMRPSSTSSLQENLAIAPWSVFPSRGMSRKVSGSVGRMRFSSSGNSSMSPVSGMIL